MYRNDMTKKEIERRMAERTPEDEAEIRALRDCDRRQFLKTSLKYAGMVAAAGMVPGHSFQLVNVAHAADGSGGFRFAYISDSHLYNKGMDHRFVRAIQKAVDDVNALDPQPDFVLFGGDLAQLGRADELELGAQILKDVKAPMRFIVGEHDWYYDMGEKWRDMFGPDHYSFDHKGIHFVALNSVVEKDFWTAKGYSPAERMDIVAGLDDNRQSSFEVGPEQREWMKGDLSKIDKKTPVIVFSHSPLYKLYKPWNFWTDDAEEVQKILKPFKTVTVIHGHTHQQLTNKIGNIQFHGMLSTAWPWPYAPEGLPEYTVQMNRVDPFNQFDGCGDGTVDVLDGGRVNKNYNHWAQNPYTVTAKELTSGKLKGATGYNGPSY